MLAAQILLTDFQFILSGSSNDIYGRWIWTHKRGKQ